MQGGSADDPGEILPSLVRTFLWGRGFCPAPMDLRSTNSHKTPIGTRGYQPRLTRHPENAAHLRAFLFSNTYSLVFEQEKSIQGGFVWGGSPDPVRW